MYYLNSSVSSFITEVITRSSALSYLMRAFSKLEFCCALRKAVSSVTREGIGLDDELPPPVGVFPVNVAEEVVERLEDVQQPVQFRLAAATTSKTRYMSLKL